ncbi:MAG: hypothetical protein HN377_09390 [Alphaproteobacteria bacterium]|nr:hypothetical protein [Alphaproteobacteria bacterium]MBT7943768.1 hypothetical protein [Alphaproteobacteria bacterium]
MNTQQQLLKIRHPVAANSNVKLTLVRSNPTARLSAAVTTMVAELEIQKKGIAQTRTNIAELDIVMNRMEGRFYEMQRTFSKIKVRGLRKSSLRLAALCRRAEALT